MIGLSIKMPIEKWQELDKELWRLCHYHEFAIEQELMMKKHK